MQQNKTASKQTSKRAQGNLAESEAAAYLKAQGLKLIETNYHSPFGEVDLIFKQKKTWVFVEVKKRSSKAYGGALASVTYAKQQKIIKTAQVFLQAHGGIENNSIRFDVFAFEGEEANWITGAF